ncbi:FtsW/RodA/SpoVE family cell cycle protein [Paenibacillus sp. MMS20-IR301]|uniref:FtsW/RodA/SpoVE family cell cycle protein n=1 Tax=Paenibacillus sp. MMS20-IR301 TaxID=2895946 RepID=UPI0028E5A992|nr:FtsW/RodA/SpoVE family cell cycle protein [Paenibacillus sp. MMS20-IR301]WNS45482.1 FtsW/RodA/SpoVE family cell cycle protein [Paenibacillus sp. MMS20-IR301]
MERNKKLEQYLDKVCAEIRAKGLHREIREELGGHYADLVMERMEQGAAKDDAEQYALQQMGDPQITGRELHQIHKPKIPWGLLSAVMLLSAVSLLGMGSIQASGFLQIYHLMPLQRQFIGIMIGVSLMAGMYFINFKHLQQASGKIYAAAVMLIAVTLVFGPELINGNRRYVGFLGFTFDLIGYSPYVFVVALAGIWTSPGFLSQRSIRLQELVKLALLLLPAGIYAAIRSFPELVVYLAVALIMYVWITRRWRSASLLTAAAVAAGALFIWNDALLRERVIGAVSYNLRPDSTGYLNRVINEVITSAGWRGHGFGRTGAELPYAYSDLFTVYLIQCFGWAGGLLLFALVGWFCLKMISYVRAVRDPYGRMLILALGLMLSVRLIYALSIISGRMFITAIPLPFLSYGQHIFIEFAAAGLLMAVYRRKDMLPGTQAPSSL